MQAYLLWEKAGKPDGADFSNDARQGLEQQLRSGVSVQDLERSLRSPQPKPVENGAHPAQAEPKVSRITVSLSLHESCTAPACSAARAPCKPWQSRLLCERRVMLPRTVAAGRTCTLLLVCSRRAPLMPMPVDGVTGHTSAFACHAVHAHSWHPMDHH